MSKPARKTEPEKDYKKLFHETLVKYIVIMEENLKLRGRLIEMEERYCLDPVDIEPESETGRSSLTVSDIEEYTFAWWSDLNK